eukprot:gene8158-9582_t
MDTGEPTVYGVEPELNTRIKSRFESAIQYFTHLIEGIVCSGEQQQMRMSMSSSPGGEISSMFYAGPVASTPSGTTTPEVVIDIDEQRPTNGAKLSNKSSSSSSSDNPSNERLIYNGGNNNGNPINNRHPDDTDVSEEDSPYNFGSCDEEENDEVKAMILARPENQSILTSLTMAMWKQSYRRREQLYFALSSVQDPIVVEQLISQSFNAFINDCYADIFARFETSHHHQISMLRLMRSAPDRASNKLHTENAQGGVRVRAPEDRPSFKTTALKFLVNATRISSILRYIFSILPILTWVPKYKIKAYLKDDVLTSLTIGFMLIPQAMAYAILGGLPPIYGLYSAFISPIVYGIFGTSNEISVGPVAMVSLLVPTIIGLPTDDPNYIIYASCLSLLSGLILLVLGLLKVGFLIETLLSNPILLGFIQSAALLIMLSQIKNFTGIPITSKAHTIIEYGQQLVEKGSNIHGWTVLMGMVALVLLVGAKQLNKKLKYKIPMPIIILVLSTLISFLIDSSQYGIKIIGDIPKGIPTPKVVTLSISQISDMFVGAVILTILGFVESISIGKKFAALRKYNISSNQELVALGMCNIVQSAFSGYPTTGSFSRTAVSFQYTPLCILSAIVLAAAITLFEIHETIDLFRKGEKVGFFQLIFVFLCTLLIGSEVGIVIAFVVSIVQIIFFSSRPNLVKLGRLPGTLVFRNTNHYPGAITHPGMIIVRYDSRMTYYTINHFRDCDIRVIIIDAINISSIDSTALDVLGDMLDVYEANDITVVWSDMRPAVWRVMQQSGFIKKIGKDQIFTSTNSAVDFAMSANKCHQFQMAPE